MAIYDHHYGDLSYFRVFRAWGGQEHQEYVRIKRSREAAYKKALEIDARLAKAQQAYMVEQALSPEYHIRDNGQIRGLRRVQVKRKGRKPIDVFELRINVPWREDVKRTTLSIAVHGEQKAFDMALDIIFECYAIKPKSALAQSLKKCYPAYVTSDGSTALENKQHSKPRLVNAAASEESHMDDFSEVNAVKNLVFKKARHEFVNLTDGLFKGLKRFTA